VLAFLSDSSRRGLGSVSVCSATRMPPDDCGVVNPIYMPGTARSGRRPHRACGLRPSMCSPARLSSEMFGERVECRSPLCTALFHNRSAGELRVRHDDRHLATSVRQQIEPHGGRGRRASGADGAPRRCVPSRLRRTDRGRQCVKPCPVLSRAVASETLPLDTLGTGCAVTGNVWRPAKQTAAGVRSERDDVQSYNARQSWQHEHE
jgi:hypothetical protein